MLQVLTLGQSRRQPHALALANFAWNGLGDKVFNGSCSNRTEHGLLVFLAGTNVTRGEFGGVHKRRN